MSTENFSSVNNISDRILKARGYAGLNQKTAAAVLGISPVTMNRYEKGGRVPETDVAVNMARQFGVSLTWLLTGQGPMLESTALSASQNVMQMASSFDNANKAGKPLPEPSNVEPFKDKLPVISVPLISWVQAGSFVDTDCQTTPGYAERHEDTTATASKRAFALRVRGDSMEPEFTDDDILIVDPDRMPEIGSFIIAKNGDGEATFKQFVKDGERVFFKPLNSRYPIMDMTGVKFSIVGVVVEKKKRY